MDECKPLVGGGGILTGKELKWVSAQVGGVDLSVSARAPCYNMEQDSDRMAMNFLSSCDKKVLTSEGANNGKMLVVVVELSSGKKIVGTTTVGRCRLTPG